MKMAYKVAEITELQEGIPFVVRISMHLEIVLIKKHNKIFALNNECPHMGGPLGEGEVENNELVCPWHQWRFNIETGACSESKEEPILCYKTFIKGNHVYLEIPEKQ